MEYVSRIDFALNGQMLDDVKNFKKLKLSPRAQVNLMNKTGFVSKTLRHQFSVDYVVPAGARYDFESVEKMPALITLDGGGKLNYSNVCCLDIGDEDYDGEKEVVVTVTFGAENLVQE